MRNSASRPRSSQSPAAKGSSLSRGVRNFLRHARVPPVPLLKLKVTLFVFAALLPSVFTLSAQTAEQAWLKYRPVPPRADIPWRIMVLGSNAPEKSASAELLRGLKGLFGRGEMVQGGSTDVIIIGTDFEFARKFPKLRRLVDPTMRIPVRLAGSLGPAGISPQWRVMLHDDSYAIQRVPQLGPHTVIVTAKTEIGTLYGTFALLRVLATRRQLPVTEVVDHPAMPIRWVDEWDNADGSIERGYAGRSIFFENGRVRDDLAPVAEYARLLASIGINGCNLNNVNNAGLFLQPEMLEGVARVANTMRPYGVRVSLSVDIASPQKIGGLPSYDPLDPAVKAWWTSKVGEIYGLIPDFAGFTVKADSEGQPGPASFGRTPADAANTLAVALAPHNGVVLYRAFVYNHHADWHDPKADRARAAYDIFHPLDGKFAPNVIIQTKEGPIDFQAREPVSPLFGGLPETSQAMELQITQEYTGQQRHLVYLAPMWKQVLDFDMRVNGVHSAVKTIIAGGMRRGDQRTVAGEMSPRPLGGLVGVAGIGQEAWLGSPLALANLYAFGRLAWNPDLTAEQIADEWTRQTLSTDPAVVRTVTKMLMESWPAYESYTGPLGLQTLTDITGSHYGPNIESSENNGWGQWHRADHDGVGMDRSVATGTGFAGQYSSEVAKIYESAASTPDDLLLFFHHVPYTWKLHNGKTVIQYLYDSHYAGAARAGAFVDEWKQLKGRIDGELYADMLPRLQYQAGHAVVWRDAITQYFLKLSGIPDQLGRAGHYPNRLEAEDARLTGYKIVDVNPWEDASRGEAVWCAGAASPQSNRLLKEEEADRVQKTDRAEAASAFAGSNACTAEWTYQGAAGRFNIAVQYFDLQGGAARFTLTMNGKRPNAGAFWSADAMLPTTHLHADNSTRHVVHNVALKPGDILRIEGTADGSDPAAVDYIETLPATPAP